ncbi:MAG: hypothetical protein ABI342_04650 [Nitrososphaera sp.]|jgi:hypothetical protein
MKTLHLAIITGSGIAVVVIIGILFLLESHNGTTNPQTIPVGTLQNDSKFYTIIDTPGLNDTYKVFQTIHFSIIVHGYGFYPCIQPDVTIYNNDKPHNPVYHENRGILLCKAVYNAQPENYTIYYQEPDYSYITNLNQTGNYTLNISVGDISVQKQFTVIEAKYVDWGKAGSKSVNELTIEDFKDTYKAGEKIDFTMKFKGLYTCGFPSSTVKNIENKTIWESPIVLTLCDPDTGYGEWNWKFTDLYTLILNQTGSYSMNISFSDKTLEKEFTIFDSQYTLHLDNTVSQESNISQSNLLSAIHPPKCEYYPNNTICHGMTTWVDNQIRDYDESQVYDSPNRPVEMDNVTFLYTGSSTPGKDNLNCDTEFPRAINVTFGHHSPIVVYDGYYKVNETRHFTVTLADGTINSTSLCWTQLTKPKITEMIDDGGMGTPIYSGMKINWLDKNKTAAIVQHQYQTEGYYNEYLTEVRK